jgi:hypothetical protein
MNGDEEAPRRFRRIKRNTVNPLNDLEQQFGEAESK